MIADYILTFNLFHVASFDCLFLPTETPLLFVKYRPLSPMLERLVLCISQYPKLCDNDILIYPCLYH